MCEIHLSSGCQYLPTMKQLRVKQHVSDQCSTAQQLLQQSSASLFSYTLIKSQGKKSCGNTSHEGERFRSKRKDIKRLKNDRGGAIIGKQAPILLGTVQKKIRKLTRLFHGFFPMVTLSTCIQPAKNYSAIN